MEEYESDENEELEDFGGDGIDYNHLFITNIRFQVFEHAFEWAREKAHSVGFSIVQKSQKTKNGIKYYTMMCDRGGKYKSRSRDPQRPLRKHTSTKKCNCPFRFLIRQSACHDGFGITTNVGVHNHRLLKYTDGHRHIARLTPEQKKYVKVQSHAHVRPGVVARGLEEAFGMESEPDIRQIYNLNAQNIKDERNGLNHAQHMIAMANHYKYTHFFEKNPYTNQLTNVLMCHPEGLKLLRTYPYVWGIDSTYKTNMYNMPLVQVVGITPVGKTYQIGWALLLDETQRSYVWLLEKLRSLLETGVVPEAIVTDRELGLMSAIEIVFPDSSHLLCLWHIMRNVEAQAKIKLANAKEGQDFFNDRWFPLVYSRQENRYLRNKQKLMSFKKKVVVSYVCSTWLVHKEKFVKCFTDKVLHFGTTTTSRVESAHSVLKKWLRSSTLALDSMWARVHTAVGRQHVEIHKLLESSRSKHTHDSHRGLFSLLNGFVSHKAIKLMKDEFDRGGKLGADLSTKCGCAFLTSHGLPCACNLHDLYTRNEKIYVEDVHMFWRTLEINEAELVAYTDYDRFKAICDEAYAYNPYIFREATMLISGLIHRETEELENPAIKETVKGRPRLPRMPTTRNKSFFEHVRRRLPLLAPSTSTETDENTVTPSHITTETDYSDIPVEPINLVYADPVNFDYFAYIPDCLGVYMCGWYNPEADGHCGFRCISHALRGDEKYWMEMRVNLLGEIGRSEYRKVYEYSRYDEGVEHARINFQKQTGCPEGNWMWSTDLYGYATMYCWAICVVGHRWHEKVRRWDGSATYLPLRAEPGIRCPRAILWLLNTGDHWIRINIMECADVPSPMPPIELFWQGARDNTVAGWDKFYQSRISRWNTKEDNAVPMPNSQSEDPIILEDD